MADQHITNKDHLSPFSYGSGWAGNGLVVIGSSQYDITPGATAEIYRVSAIPQRIDETVWTFRSDGTNVITNPWRVSGAGLVRGSDTTLWAGKAPAVVRLPGGKVLLFYIDGTTAKVRTWSAAGGAGVAQNIGTATIGDILFHRDRLLLALYNSGWFIVVGTWNAGTLQWNLSTPVSMALSSPAAKGGRFVVLPGGPIGFVYINTSNVEVLVTCKNLSDSGVGSWA